MIHVIVPVFNEEAPLEGVLLAVPAVVNGHRVSCLVVSDGSTDETVAVARAGGARVIALVENRGKGTAVQAGLAAVDSQPGDAVVIMDGDGQHDPADLARLVAPVLNGQAEIAIASRYKSGQGRGSTPVNRYLVRVATVALLRRLIGTEYSDPYCGFRAFSNRAVRLVRFSGARYEGELEVLFDADRLGLSTEEVGIEKIYGSATSKMSMDGGRLVGRARVLLQYIKTIVRKLRERSALGEKTSLPVLEEVL